MKRVGALKRACEWACVHKGGGHLDECVIVSSDTSVVYKLICK